MPDQPTATGTQWQKILDAALAGARDDAHDQVGDAMCEAYSLGVAAGIERQSVQTAPRRVPTMAERFTDVRGCGHTPEQHRHQDGQDADAASHARAIRELAAERNKLVDAIGRMISLPPEAIATAYEVGYSERETGRRDLTFVDPTESAWRQDAPLGGYQCPPSGAESCAAVNGTPGNPNCAHCRTTVAGRASGR